MTANGPILKIWTKELTSETQAGIFSLRPLDLRRAVWDVARMIDNQSYMDEVLGTFAERQARKEEKARLGNILDAKAQRRLDHINEILAIGGPAELRRQIASNEFAAWADANGLTPPELPKATPRTYRPRKVAPKLNFAHRGFPAP